MEGGIAAHYKTEESSDHEAHHASLYRVAAGIVQHVFELVYLLSELTGVLEGQKVALELLLPQKRLVRVVHQTHVALDLG